MAHCFARGDKLMVWDDMIGSCTTHSRPLTRARKSGGGVAAAVAWILNAALLSIMAGGFAISAAAYSVAVWTAMHDLLVGAADQPGAAPFEAAALNQMYGDAESR
jgi:hypothetical protein